MKWRKRGRKEVEKGRKRETQPRVFTVALFAPFFMPFFHFPQNSR
jgi:hypothetical protein